MSVHIELLGVPLVRDHGVLATAPRGRKAWALLAYLLLTERAPSRERVATLLFEEAADPLGALRWNLAQLRKTLGDKVEIGGEPLTVVLPEGSRIDTDVLAHGDPESALEVPGLGRDLLEGIDLPDSPAFETWLLAERRRFAGISAAVLREAATARMAAGRAHDAVGLASRLVAIEDFDEEAHALLVRAYVASGDLERARRQSAKSAAYLRDELGLEPSATLARALDGALDTGRRREGTPSRRAIEALIEAGRAATNAGAVEAGLQTLRQATSQADASGSAALAARARLAEGIALIHTVRGRDGEGATALHAALAAAEHADDAASASEAARELGYIEFLRARYDRAETWLQRAMASAPDDVERAAALGVLGAVESDRGRTRMAIEALTEAADVGRRVQKPRTEALARSMLGRVHALCLEHESAIRESDRAVDICRAAGWMSFLPFPQSMSAAVRLANGDIEAAAQLFEAAFALGCQIGDPCWEGLGARGLGLIELANGRVEAGFEWLDDAAVRCVRVPDAYLWIEAYVLDALCEQGLRHGRPEVAAWSTRLETLASRTSMREMLVRSHLHRAGLGDADAMSAARLLARDIDNPAVLERLAPVPAPLRPERPPQPPTSPRSTA